MIDLLSLLLTIHLQATLLVILILLFRRIFRYVSKRYVCLLWVLLFFSFRYLLQFRRVGRALKTAVHREGNVWECDGFSSPFVMGCFKPKIYIPFSIPEEQRSHIIRHESMHIRHLDPFLCCFAVLAICIHWWNPFLWYAIGKMKQDIELFCDESVLRFASIQEKNLIRKHYYGLPLGSRILPSP